MVRSIPISTSVDAREYSHTSLRQVPTRSVRLGTMAEAMEDVVHLGGQGYGNNGTAWAYIGQNIPYRMAGKSGTAQVVEYLKVKNITKRNCQSLSKHAWFMAFAFTQTLKLHWPY